ncbi:MAG: PH domain-containing protein [Chloroflexi bacterium]|nr:PH domain-containing protein [Chloroflexota bacterium]
MLQGIFGNATEADAKAIQKDLDDLLADGEQVVKAFKIVRDLFVFTDHRLILIDKQGVTGKKAEYHSIPYRSITHFSVETAGTFDMDAEMKIYVGSSSMPIERQFKRGTNIVGVQKTLAQQVFKR